MNFNAEYVRKSINENGEVEITLRLNNLYDQEMIKSLEKNKLYRFNASIVKSKRSIEQNNFMWAVIDEICTSLGGKRERDSWNLYIQALERAGAKYEYIAIVPEASNILVNQFRAIQKMNSFEHKGRTFDCYKVFYGSSKMNKEEMNLLIDTVLDMANECGVIITDTMHEL